MRLNASDPDVQTLYRRIADGDLDLQPDFQRGEVWTRAKKQRLIDSILRDWHVPPIHVIENTATKRQEVLDGQQRLTAIRDFVEGGFPVDGAIQPLDERIARLDGRRFGDLDADTKRQFNRFQIRVFSIIDFKPSEPGELFYRLNQPTNLTSAEQRNAFFGPVREQVRMISAILGGPGSSLTGLGFTNARMSFDDVVARVALAFERRNIYEKIRASDLADLYRSDRPLSDRTLGILHDATNILAAADLRSLDRTSLNKAAIFSWLTFLGRSLGVDYRIYVLLFSDFFTHFEFQRINAKHFSDSLASKSEEPDGILFRIYDDRSSARVSDVSSVILRDGVIWYMFVRFAMSQNVTIPFDILGLSRVMQIMEGVKWRNAEESARFLVDSDWGRLA